MNERNLFKEFIKFITNRIFIMFILFCALFYVLITRLFDLQIVNGETYLETMSFTTQKKLSISAPRGNIYDRMGRPLAVNKSAYVVKFDPSIIDAYTQTDELNQVLCDFILLLEQNGEEFVDDFPISATEPYQFTFDENEKREMNWKREMGIKEKDLSMTASETMEYLRISFDIPEELSNDMARKLLNFRVMIYMQRYRQYSPITVAYDVEEKTITALEEENMRYKALYVDLEPLRYYPAGIYFSHVLGRVGVISDEEWETMKVKGYSSKDIIGKTGLERAFENELRGEDGEMEVEVNNMGRRIRIVEDSYKDPKQGDKIILTMDQNLQEKSYHILESTLTSVLQSKLRGLSSKESPIALKDLFRSMVNSNNISLQKIFDAPEDSYSGSVFTYVRLRLEDASLADDESIKAVKEVVMEGIEDGKITGLEMLLVLHEQGIITGDETYIAKLKSGAIRPLDTIIEKLGEGEITPQMTNLDPSTGSVVVVDVKTGGVLAAIGYPSYDNNELVNNWNNEYYTKIAMMDPTQPMINRPFSEPRAPGSTFKMISAIAALESDAIQTSTLIRDEVTFTKAGTPTTSCWSSVSHGLLNVSHALEVSCNYFFCEAIYRIGNSKTGNKLDSIETLNRYMAEFGLDERSGVEIGELSDSLRSIYPDDVELISSPSLKKHVMLSRNEDAPFSEYDWYDGDTVKTAIGQSNNNYTPASMAKYIATLATKGVRYQLHLLDEVQSQHGETVRTFTPNVETNIKLSEDTWQAVYEGMLMVTEGTNGTGKDVFKDFPIRVAGKTGTAEENAYRNDHSSFGGFAPYEEPEIAVYVSMPFGDSKALTHAASRVAREVIAEYMGLNSEPERPDEENALAE